MNMLFVYVHVLSYFVHVLICLQICDCGSPSCENGFPIDNFHNPSSMCVRGRVGKAYMALDMVLMFM